MSDAGIELQRRQQPQRVGIAFRRSLESIALERGGHAEGGQRSEEQLQAGVDAVGLGVQVRERSTPLNSAPSSKSSVKRRALTSSAVRDAISMRRPPANAR